MLFRHIVIGLDFTSPSLNAARFALKRFRPSSVTFAHVLSTEVGTMDLLEQSRDAMSRLREVAHVLDVPDSRLEVASGGVDEELALVADDVGADLICIGVPRPLESAVVGETARTVVARANIPTLLVPPGAANASVHAVWTDADAGELVLLTASAIAEDWGRELNALCFLREDASCTTAPDGIEQRRLAQILQQADVADVETVRVDSLRGRASAGTGLSSYIAAKGPGLIVCDRSSARRFLLSGGHAGDVNDANQNRGALAQCPLLALVSARQRWHAAASEILRDEVPSWPSDLHRARVRLADRSTDHDGPPSGGGSAA